MIVEATLAVNLDDRLLNDNGLVTNRPPTKCDAKLRATVDKKANAMMRAKDFHGVLTRYDPPGGLFGFFAPKSVPVELVSCAKSWDAKGVLRFKFAWKIDTTDVDLSQVRNALTGGITDGWGETIQQLSRFGELCVIDDNGVYKKAVGKERSSLNAGEHGRYALLFTMVGAKMTLRH